jgi:adenine/guanine/hypoxanthine permease
MSRNKKDIRWFRVGDLNGFLGLMTDNMASLSFIAAILIFGFKFPADVVFKYMFPGTAFGVFIGDLIFTVLGVRMARKLGRNDLAAMPLGLDTPSAIGLAVTVLGPAFMAMTANGVDPHQAALNAWYIGMAAVVAIGVLKILAVSCAGFIQRIVPKAGLLGSLAGVCIALIGFMPLVNVFSLPIVGVISLGIVLYTLIAKIDLPKKVPGVFVAILVGTLLYHVLGPMGITAGTYTAPSLKLYFGLPIPTLGFIHGFIPMLKYLPIVIPFAILVIVGDINVTESARVGGDPYDPKKILLIDGICTVVGGICGSVSQTTAYIGQPAYKQMGARMGYTLLAGLFIGLGGILGYISFFVTLIPTAVLAPILIFVAIEIVSQAFLACPARHAPAVCFAMFPSIARFVALQYTNPAYISLNKLKELISHAGQTLPEILVTIALGNGFIFVGMLWGGMFAEMINRNLRRSSVYLFILAALSFFGVVHSSSLEGKMYFPWTLQAGPQQELAYYFALGYLILGTMIFCMSFTHGAKKPADPTEGEMVF